MSIKKIQFSPVKTTEKDSEEEKSVAYSSNENLTVKFQITDTQIIAHSYKRTQTTLGDMKRDIAGKFKVINHSWLDILDQDEELLSDERVKLNDLSRNQFGIVELQLRVNERGQQARAKLDLNVYYSHFTLPEIITVNLGEEGDGQRTDRKLIVEIENRRIRKPFLGGYRDPGTKIEFHHACTQTGPMPRPGRNLVLSRETQTEAHLMKSLRTTRMTPRNEIREFVSSDEMVGRLDKLKRVKVIQRNFRAYKWRKLIRESAQQWRVIQEKAKERTNYDTNNADYNRVLRLLYMEPTAKEEFDQVYAALKHWKREETLRLKELHSDGAYIAELNLVLEKEIFLLNEVKQRKSIVQRQFKEKSSERLLTRLGRPKRFISTKKTVLEIDTLRSQRIRFWTDFYNDLKCTPVDKLKRLELIDKVLTSLEEEEGNYNKLKDLQGLFERERNLWEINFSSSDLDTLRDRQLLLLFDLIQAIGKDEKSTSPGRDLQRICGKCKKLLPTDRFVLLGRKDIPDIPDICQPCSALHQSSGYANVYREILRAIRRDERRSGALASFAFIIQAQDVQYIVETIWHGHSILSQTTDRHRLRLPRWMPSEDWSPWNCICLTENEAKTHLKLRDFKAVYQDHLLKLITSRNNLALTAFERLREINYEFVESGQWWRPLDKDKDDSSSSAIKAINSLPF